ncbi:hypothetical protein L227DRAFT_572310 [Lentinus tigrinus ALCF2SS1-6]|uniref:BTB domain-containing protein n=1 Tax=Lentinus tigrinus ALCF2SS1-6 TaxID=1328759 RepID=A0A5C2SJS6_9APHY|nr:hypothetical protein L227DRAFT_572310 [Lentinus tigrinus ALCF2SS1-6]
MDVGGVEHPQALTPSVPAEEQKRKWMKNKAKRRKPSGLYAQHAGTREQVSQLAMLTSITSGTFEDVKFYTFSRRTRAGTIDSPLPLYGNSALIRKASSHFNFVFAQGFAECGIVDLDAAYPQNRPSSIDMDDYSYASDSDLDDEPEDSHVKLATSFAELSLEVPVGPSGGRHEEPITEGDSSTANGKSENQSVSGTGVVRPARPGRVVFLDDVAYRTWKAFIFYAYFDQIAFAPLKSQEQLAPERAAPFDPPPCSPKSMYRLAEKYGIEALKAKAAEDIKKKLSTENILTELFSSFTLTHQEIEKMELEFLHKHIGDANLLSRLPKWFQYLANGELPDGAANVFATLVNKLVMDVGKLKRP